jgi:glycosyltransferase involved in cell wall biosynthesis
MIALIYRCAQNKTMRLLYDHTIFRQTRGGISRVFYEIIRRIAACDGVDVDVFMGPYCNEYGLERYKGSFKSFWGYWFPDGKKMRYFRKFLTDRAWARFQANIPPGDDLIYHPTYYDFYETHIKKRVFTVYDFTHERCPEFFVGDPVPEAKKKAFDSASGLICISESTKNDLIELYDPDPSCKIKTIHLGFNDLSQIQAPGGVIPDAPYILFVGGRYSYKNFNSLVEAYAISPDLQKDFNLVCLGHSFLRRERAFFEERGISGKVIAISGGDDILGALYKNARMFVFPSLYEGFGLPLLEAMSCGCPVVAGNSSSFPEVAGNAAVLCDPSSPEALAEAIRKVAYGDDFRKTLISAGYERCKLYSWDRCARETYDFYKEVLS